MLLSIFNSEDKLVLQIFGLSNDDCEREAVGYDKDYRFSYSCRLNSDVSILYAYTDEILSFCDRSGIDLDISMSPMDIEEFFKAEISTGKFEYTQVKSMSCVIELLRRFYKDKQYFDEILF